MICPKCESEMTLCSEVSPGGDPRQNVEYYRCDNEECDYIILKCEMKQCKPTLSRP